MKWPRRTSADELDEAASCLWGRMAPTALGSVWMAVLLGTLAWLDRRQGGTFLVPPFAATTSILVYLPQVSIAQPLAMTSILVYLPQVSIAQPLAIVMGCTVGAVIGTVLSLFIGFGPGVAVLGALVALITLHLARVYHPPGVALAMYAPLLHPGLWFPVEIVLPFTVSAVISAMMMSRPLRGWPQYSSPPAQAGRTWG
jgi:CBS-domain-containing membrane protein